MRLALEPRQDAITVADDRSRPQSWIIDATDRNADDRGNDFGVGGVASAFKRAAVSGPVSRIGANRGGVGSPNRADRLDDFRCNETCIDNGVGALGCRDERAAIGSEIIAI